MFKSWRSDKKKIKVVFQLQFQATQVRTRQKLLRWAGLVVKNLQLGVSKISPDSAFSFSGATVEKVCGNDSTGAGGCWKADTETRESRSSGWQLFVGESCLWNYETHQGVKNRETEWKNLPFRCFKCMYSQEFLSFSSPLFKFQLYANYSGLLQGSSKAGFLGEASIDFADFAAETEPITVSLPLKFANSGAILHVSSLSRPLS